MIFIDCGAYKGKALSWARKKYNDRKLYAFECNPHLSRINYGDDVTIIKKAIWTKDGNLRFYLNTKNPLIEGNTVYKDKITGNIDSLHPITVPCIDFSKWISSIATESDFVVVKMNVEGSEYDVLEHCIKNGTIKLIKELHIQWHYKKIPCLFKRHQELVEKLSKISSLKVFNGYGNIKPL